MMTYEKYIRLFLFSILIFYSTFIKSQNPFVNEICASNYSILSDSSGDYPDWIELYNPGTLPVELGNFSISDDPDSLQKWIFPEYSLNPGNYLVIFASGKDIKETSGYWNSLISGDDEWKYIVPDEETGEGWKERDFDDSEWVSGATGIGYGDGDDETLVDSGTLSVFLRKSFQISNISQIKELILSVDYDDAFVAYINGTEIARANISKGYPPAFDATADQYTEPKIIQGGQPDSFTISEYNSILVEGENILAIQVHNYSTGSSDLSIIPFLSYKSDIKTSDDPDPVTGLISSGFHTNFRIDKDGDSLYLSTKNGELLQLFPVEYNYPDYSLGFPDDSGDIIKAFTNPTPWYTNSTTSYYLNEPGSISFDKSSGYYPDGLNAGIQSENPDEKVYYTTDGSDPDANSELYTSPVQVTESITIKARVIKTGYLPGEIITASYYTKNTNNLPTVFISTEPSNLWDEETGIYVKGLNAEEKYPYFGANFWEDWEKPATIEYFTSEGKPGFSMNAGIKIYGCWSRAQSMKSLAIFARNEYGDKSIDYKIFDNKDIDQFEALVLRNSGNEWFGESNMSGVMFRDLLMTELAGTFNVDVQAGQPVAVYLNGSYWGIHNLREKINEHFISENHTNINPDRINLLVGNNGVVNGNAEDYIQIEEFIGSNSMEVQDNYEYIKTKIDIESFINYELAQIYYYNGDWPGNNIKYWKFDADYSKWRWIMYDTDFGLGLWDESKVLNNTLEFATATDGPDWPNPDWSTFMLRNLLLNQEFREQFINSMADRMNTVFLADSFSARANSHADLIRDEMQNHIDQWGGNISTWESNVQNIISFIEDRPVIMRSHMRSFFDISQNRKINLVTEGVENAEINLNSLILNEFPWNGYYYDQIPVSIKAIAPENTRFVRWEGSIESEEQELVLDMTSDFILTAVFEPCEKDEFEGVIINEIAYNDPLGSQDWIELFNNSENIKNISGWTLKDSDEDHNFTFADGSLLMPYDYLVVAEDQESFTITSLEIQNYTGNTQFGLNKTGECIRLFNQNMVVVDSVCYASEYPWPESPLETGNPIALKNPDSDNNLGYNWSPSSESTGTPGSSNLMNEMNEIFTGNENNNIVLYQNYPNPFKEETTIEFRLSQSENIILRIFNLNGELVAELINENLTPGYHSANWHPVNSPSGIYILQMQSNSAAYQKRMILSH